MRTSLLIDGDLVDGGADGFDTINPATEEVIREVGAANRSDVDAAVDAARAAFQNPQWRRMPGVQRANLLFKLADALEQHAQEFAELETTDQGQPIGMALNFSVGSSVEHLRYYAGWATKIEGETVEVGFPETFAYTQREPVGVCGLITPWNVPLMILVWKIAPALATGNVVIVKPAEQTPLTTIRFVELCEEVGFPPGVVNLLTGAGDVGAALVEHQGVDKISFTGSTEVGRSIVRASADNLKRVTLELGGKNPSIIGPDVDMDVAVGGNIAGATINSGQVCAAYSRFYVAKKREDEFVTKVAGGLQGMTLGPGIEESSQMGPLVSAEHLANVSRMVDAGKESGAELVTGGARRGDKGFYYEPTIFRGVADDSALATDEIFGPVMSVLTYDDEDELAALLKRANNTNYGLASTIWSRDLGFVHRVAAGIRAGAVFVNMPPIPDMAMPWGGMKSSGWGREMGKYALEAFTEVKGVWVHYGE